MAAVSGDNLKDKNQASLKTIIENGFNTARGDTAEYYYREKDILSLQEDNMSQIMNEIFYNIFTITGYRDIYYLKRYFETISSKYADFNKSEFLLNPSEHLIEMRKLIEEDFGIRLNTFNDSHILMIKKVECEKIKRKIL